MLTDEEKLRVVFTGGGTGGHVYPLLAVAEALHKRIIELKAPAEFVYLGPKDSYSDLLSRAGFSVRSVVGARLNRSGAGVLGVPMFFLGFIQALFHLYVVMPDVIFSKGGTGAFPVVLAGWFYRIPVIIHESDAQPGLTNLASSRFARKVFVNFARAGTLLDPRKTEVVGAPLRAELLAAKTGRELAKEALGFDVKQPLVAIIGGSQGSTRINEFVLKNLKTFVETAQMLHQTGVGNFAEVEKIARSVLLEEQAKNRYKPVNYIDNMGMVLAAADVVIARSGSSVFELAAFGVPSILIPLKESANGHQRINAYEYSKGGAAIVIEEVNLMPGIFFPQLASILTNAELYAKMSAAATAMYVPGGAERIAEEIVQLAAGV